jgi:hypothetical protein
MRRGRPDPARVRESARPSFWTWRGPPLKKAGSDHSVRVTQGGPERRNSSLWDVGEMDLCELLHVAQQFARMVEADRLAWRH